MRLHDLRNEGKTLSAPVCKGWRPAPKRPGASFFYTLMLVWDIEPENIGQVIWPDYVSDTDRTKILRAVLPKQDGAKVTNLPRGKHALLDVDVRPLLGGEEIGGVLHAPALLVKQEIVATEDNCRVTALLRIEVHRDSAPLLLDLWDADVVVTVRRQAELPLEGKDPEPDKQLRLGPADEPLPAEAGSYDEVPHVRVASAPVPRNDGLTPEESLQKPAKPSKRRPKKINIEAEAESSEGAEA